MSKLYNVLIVDDEPMIRFGLASSIDWQEEQFLLLGDAANGQEALEKAREKQVDILITDIKMPIMDGLELTRQMKRKNPGIKVILVSSYSDFEFAREAVQLGVVVDYLLKPTMEPEDLVQLLKKCRKLLDEENRRFHLEQKMAKESDRNQLNRFISDLKNHLSTSANQFAWIPDWASKPLLVSVWSLDLNNKSEELALDRLLKMELSMEKLMEWLPQSAVFLSSETELVLLSNHTGHDGFHQLENIQRKLMERGVSFTVGISPEIHGLKSFNEAYGWAKAALSEAFFEERKRCFQGQIGNKAAMNEEERLDKQRRWQSVKEMFSGYLAEGDFSGATETLQNIFQSWVSLEFSRNEIMKQAESLLTMLWSREHAVKNEEMMNRILDQLKTVRNKKTLNDLIKYIQQEQEDFIELEDVSIHVDDFKGVHVIQLALSYIQEHFNDDLSLQEVADHVHMSKNYFSEQFKKRTGLNFIDFVIRVRIYHAKQLLRTTGLKIQEVGEKSGFNSPKHFLKIFKREVQCTPAEYRKMVLK